MRILLAIIFLLTSNTALANEMLAELELAWGDTQEELFDKGFKLSNCAKNKTITSCEAIHPINGDTFGALYILFFDDNSGLQKLQMPIRYMTTDTTGSEGKASYSALKKYLNQKYNQPKSYEYIGRKLYGEYDEFYQCLHYDGCGSWVSIWETQTSDYVYIALVGVSKGTGYLTLYNESKHWQEIVASRK